MSATASRIALGVPAHPSAVPKPSTAARQWAVDAEAGGCEPREWTDIPEPFREAQRRQAMPEPPT